MIVGIGYLLEEYVRIRHPAPMKAYASFARITIRSAAGLGSAKSAASDVCYGSGCRAGTARKRYLIFFIRPKANDANGFRCFRVESDRVCKWQAVCTAVDAVCFGGDSKARQV